MEENIRLLLIDDNALICDSMTRLIDKCGNGLKVCGSAMNQKDAMHMIRTLRPDVSLVDISLNGSEGGLELMRQIREEFPESAILAVSLHDEDLYAERALRAGANGYLIKGDVGRCINDAMHEILNGRPYISGKAGAEIIARFLKNSSESLTLRPEIPPL